MGVVIGWIMVVYVDVEGVDGDVWNVGCMDVVGGVM